MTRTRNPDVDPQRRQPANAFDSPHGYSGQEYHPDRDRAEIARDPSGAVSPRAIKPGDRRPVERGTAAWVDPTTGEVHGSGSGAGGGNPGEDYDDDAAAGGGGTASISGTKR